MKTDLNSIDREKFFVNEGVFCGEQAFLVCPQGGTKFTKETAIYRSSIWDAEGNLLCGGGKNLSISEKILTTFLFQLH